MSRSYDGPTFQDVFRFRAPAPEEVGRAVADLELKLANGAGSMVGLEAFLSVDGIGSAVKDIMGQTSLNMAEEFGISPKDAHTMVMSGFVGAIEFVVALRLRTDD